MRLAAFIRANAQQIIGEWENFAQTLVPAAEHMTPLALRNHINEILIFIADDIQSVQTASEQVKKSRGETFPNPKYSPAETHASLRQAGGFNLDQMVSEYRALRASVIKLWKAQLAEPTINDIRDLTRFNESIDQELTESISHYSKKLDYSRNLFLGILSHDLRSPLGAIRMSAELTLTMGVLSERQTMLISQIVESTDRVTEIVTHLLDLTRARLGTGLSVIKRSMDMGFVSRQLVHEMRTAHPTCNFTLEIEGDVVGQWDKARIGQVFSNLLGNAIQYGFTDSSINVTVKGSTNDVAVSIHNMGIPIPSAEIGKIFDSLTRGEVEEGDEYRSGSMNLGLGLYITREIVSAHGGTINVTSSEKEGTTFTARFPRSA